MPDTRSFLTFFLLWLAGNGLRLTILAVPPVIAFIILDFRLSGAEVGLLNAIPVFLFALVAVPGALLIARVGAVPALVAGLAIVAAGSALRGLSFNAYTLYAATIVMGCGVAVMQPALPSIVRQWVPARIGFATAVYTNGLLVGEIFPVTLTALALRLVGNWHADLVLWSVPVAIIAMAIFLFQPPADSKVVARPHHWMPDWRDPLLWKIGLIMGGISQLYFCSNAFLPAYLLQLNRTELIGPSLTALNCGQLPASFILLAMASRWERKKWPLITAGFLGLAGVAVILLAGASWQFIVGAAIIGFASATVLTLTFALPALLVAPDDVSRVSAGMLTIGYSFSMSVSVLCGIAWDLTQNSAFAFLPITISTLPIIVLSQMTDLSTRRS